MCALDIRTNKNTFSELESKYCNFYCPALEILVGEGKTKLIKEGIAIDRLRVDTSIYKSDVCSFKVVNAYDIESSSFKYLGDYFKPGNKVEVQTGYVDKLETIFEGIITSIKFEMTPEDVPQIIVEASDKSFLMMKGTKSETWLKKKYSEVAQAIGSKYSLTCTVDDSGISKEAVKKVNMSDYNFLRAIAKELNYEFFVTGGNLYFRKARKASEALTTLTWGKNLSGFYPEFDLAPLVTEVAVRCYDTGKKKVVESKAASAENPGANYSSAAGALGKLCTSGNSEYIYRNVDSADEAAVIAKAAMNSRAGRYISGSGESIGIPEIQPGRFINIEGIGDSFNGKYYITSAVHIINSEEYKAVFDFNIGSNDPFYQDSGAGGNRVEGNMYGVQVGIVTNNKDPEGLGRVKVKFPLKETDDESEWISVTAPMAGKEMGIYFLPEVGDQVLVLFDDSPIPRQYVVGTLWNNEDKPPETNSDGKNNLRKIKTRSGHEFIFNDESGKESITLKTKGGQKLNMEDASSGKIQLQDQSGNNKIIIDGAGNEMTIQGNMKINLKSQSCKVSIDSAQNSITIESPMQLKLKGQMVDIEAGASLNIKSDGILNIKGTMVKIN